MASLYLIWRGKLPSAAGHPVQLLGELSAMLWGKLPPSGASGLGNRHCEPIQEFQYFFCRCAGGHWLSNSVVDDYHYPGSLDCVYLGLQRFFSLILPLQAQSHKSNLAGHLYYLLFADKVVMLLGRSQWSWNLNSSMIFDSPFLPLAYAREWHLLLGLVSQELFRNWSLKEPVQI